MANEQDNAFPMVMGALLAVFALALLRSFDIDVIGWYFEWTAVDILKGR